MKKSFSYKTRSKNLLELKEKFFDLVIIGGGITGAGVARDAASRGMSVALIEANDFAFGTSSRSSKLIHGGIRYLENKDFHLVFEALSERRRLFEIAPHLVHPLRFVLPVYDNDRVGMNLMGLGMWLYDALALFETPQMHERFNAKETQFELPFINERGLLGSYAYSDAYMDDDRPVIETLRSANDHGATCVNFVKAVDAIFTNGKMTSIVAEDLITKSDFKISAKHFVSTVGPWTDIVATDLLNDWKKILRPSKGIHFTLEHSKFPLKKAVVMSTRTDKRIVFGIPRSDMVIVGTTDTDFNENPETVHSDTKDVQYLLGVVNGYFSGLNLKATDIVSTYSGVRPLIHDGSSTESKTSREHLIVEDPRNITFVAGGKYTTYRLMSEQIVKSTLKHFSIGERMRFSKSKTKLPLNEHVTIANWARAKQYSSLWAKEFEQPISVTSHLADRYGMEAEDILKAFNNQKASVWEMEAHFAIENTMCLNLLDFYLRRTPLFLSKKDHGLSFIKKISSHFAHEYGWSDSESQSQVQKINDHIEFEMGWRKNI